ncbi:TetR/AcrR family transcriptional regulator [Nocardia sp. SC052]|uniref:TetR/AcrR family transcriptional regulator n=1 Tax=Nocardia sichangensis TaxID=3385975 RepID=UPI0039A297BB
MTTQRTGTPAAPPRQQGTAGSRAPRLRGPALREAVLDIACQLFYDNGVHAVGVDEVVRRAGIAKASLYRWFPTKDALILAVLDRIDQQLWARWDEVAEQFADDAEAELRAQITWMTDMAASPGYRGCAFVNTAAEFSERHDEIRDRCLQHERELGMRLRRLGRRLAVPDPDSFADQLQLGIVGTFTTSGLFSSAGPGRRLPALLDAILAANLGR